ncbi:LIC_10190 family membrane protein [Flavobacterium luteum]|uniref:DUF8201 domain-containing protein n=1 Tax=Flavobacterium luteum TaxID=2026654 RepID=A0A7J5A974_9FLAO|nr:hypothetical protein [Flavobacterium luteum]KAB1154116.1 hypothetical protein F6464_13520 [Flavobacterium luteum]
MLLIILSWIYILFTTINLGFGFDKIVGLKNTNFIVTSILGLFSVTVLASIWAIFGRINFEFYIFILIINCSIFLKYRTLILSSYRTFFNELKLLDTFLKFFLTVSFFLIVAQCASIPYVIDNESYYIQTIKWLNEYGFVKGLANLHLFLGQQSGWHITQSAFNFSFLYKNFNDLSGFCLLLGNIFAVQKLNEYYKSQNKTYLIIGLLPLVNIFFFQFISAPSPDIAVYIFSFIICFYFLENYKKTSIETFNLLVILILFLLYIKNTTLTFVLIPILLFFRNFEYISKKLFFSFSISLIVLVLFFTKNIIVCGSLIFPSKLPPFFVLDYTISDTVETLYYKQLKNYYGYFLSDEQFNTMSTFDLFLNWLSLPKLNGLFNKLSVLLIVICPFLIYKFQNKKALWILYVMMIIQLCILFSTSPQYRFFMNFVLFFSLFCVACFINRRKFITLMLLISLIPMIIIVFIPINLNRFSNHKFMLEMSTFSFKNAIYPYKNTKYNTQYEKIKTGNLNFNSPIENDFFWGCGDGDLPCVNKEQISFYEKYYNIKPQMRTSNLKDGFYTKKVNPNEL